MSKVTKKAFTAAPNFIIAVDYKAASGKFGYDMVALQAGDVLNAMQETDNYFTDEVYLIHVLQKEAIADDENGESCISYDCKLVTRQHSNYHCSTEQNSENPFKVNYYPSWHKECKGNDVDDCTVMDFRESPLFRH